VVGSVKLARCPPGEGSSTSSHLHSDLHPWSVFDQVPLLDGSASGWVSACQEAGIVPALDERGEKVEAHALKLQEVVTVHEGDAWVAGFPSDRPTFTYGIHFPQVRCLEASAFSFWPSC
jgi:UDP-3-O-acyl-N-acetylglucosamine deacetylase